MRKLILILLVAHIFCGVLGGHISTNLTPRIDPLVSTSVGLIRGLRSDDGLYSKFLGIPYALVDEENPFAPSTPYPDFEEPFNAYDGSIICPQVTFEGQIAGHIQCLHLNIYVPDGAHSQNRLPVMVYIHGGAFTGGNGTDPPVTPLSLLQKDVIVILINYRLGIYGFMCTDSPKAPGNIGLRDQWQALRWINRHIESFGGNKNKVTIFGQSAGGMSVHLHLLSPYEKFYDRVIIQSGSATSPFSLEDTNNDVPFEVAKKLGFDSDDLDEAIDFIAKVNVHLAIAAGQIKKDSQYSFEPVTKPCVEKQFEGIERFVTENPNAVRPVKAKTTPVMIGYTTQELEGQHQGRAEEFFTNYSFADTLSYGFDIIDDDMLEYLRHFYIGDDGPENAKDEIVNFASDFVFNHPTRRAVKLLMESEVTAVYQFKFSYVGSLSTYSVASHSDDIVYLFSNGKDVSEENQRVTERLATMWTNFAKYGNPTPQVSDLLPVKWEPVSKESTPYLNIDKDLSMASAPFHERLAFWDLFYLLNEEKTKWYKG